MKKFARFQRLLFSALLIAPTVSTRPLADPDTNVLTLSSNEILQIQCSSQSVSGARINYGNVGLLAPGFKTAFFSETSSETQICEALNYAQNTIDGVISLLVKPIPGTDSLWIDGIK